MALFSRLGLIFLVPLFLLAASLPEKYPSYAYVFNEFGVDEAYIYDRDFEDFVQKNEKHLKRFYQKSLKKEEGLLPLMKGYLMDDGLSDLFIYLSMIESGFSSDIVSPKKAVGLWQFMPETAKHYNLAVEHSFDERYDPISSTTAAIAYLKKLHAQFGKWYLAAIAYNCGEGRLEKAIRKAGSDELSILLNEEEKYLPKETRAYIKKILLLAMIGEGESIDVVFDLPNTEQKSVVEVDVLGGTSLRALASLIEIDEAVLLKMNRAYKKGIVPREKRIYTVVIPETKMAAFYLRYVIPKDRIEIKPHLLSHYVKAGETLKSIAYKYGSSVEEIKQANHLYDENLPLDKLLVIPVNQNVFEMYLMK